MHKYIKILMVIFIFTFCPVLFAAPEGNRPCIVTYLYVGNSERDADAVFERYARELIRAGWHEGITRGVGFQEYINFTDLLYLLHCDSIITEGVQNTNEQFGVTLMNFNSKILVLTWSNSQTRYLFYKTYLP